MSQKVITSTLFALGLAVVISLILSFLAVLGMAEKIPYLDENQLSLLPGISISCGGMIAILAFFRDKQHQESDRIRKSDEIYLNLARESFDEVFALLKDQNNDRVIWIRASRLLLQALEIKKKIKTQDITEAFELAEERLRTELYRTLSISTGDHKNRQPLPPQFFYGIEDWDAEKNLDNAAIKGSSKIVASTVTIHENIPNPASGGLAVHSVIAIYNFLKFPVDYRDPLGKVEKWPENWADSHDVDQGARRYVAHVSEKYVINGKLYSRDG